MPLHFKSWGNRDDRPLVLLHGFLGSSRDWREVAPMLSDKFWCIAPDLPGHGSSVEVALDEEPSIDLMASRVLDLMANLSVGNATVLGYSMGGRVALNMALNRPEIINSLILESTSPGLNDEIERTARINLDDEWCMMIRERGMSYFLRRWYEQPIFESLCESCESGDRLSALIEERSGNNAAAILRVLHSTSPGRVPSIWKRLPGLTMPTLLLGGLLDQKYTFILEKMAGLLPRAILHMFENTSHNAHFEEPDNYCRTISEFLRDTQNLS